MAKISGGVEVLGRLVPLDSTDEYPVIDPFYGIDGLRSVATLVDRNNIPAQRRRHGMVVFVQAEEQYYKLNSDLIGWSIWEGGSGGGTPTPTVINVYSEPVVIASAGVDDNTVPNFVVTSDGDSVIAGVY